MRSFFPRHRRHHSALLSTACCLLLACASGCSEDDGPAAFTHHYNPSFTSDGRTVVAGLWIGTEGTAAPADAANLVIVDVASHTQTRHFITGFAPQNRIWGETHSEAFAVNAGGRITFISTAGAVLGALADAGGVTPTVACFGDSTVLWAGSGPLGHTVIGLTSHSGSPWQPTGTVVLMDSAFDGSVLDIANTSPQSFAINLSSGCVVEYTYNGMLLSQFTFPAYHRSDPSKNRLHYYQDALRYRRLYSLSDSGIVLFDLNQRIKKYAIIGSMVNFDVNGAGRWLIMETETGDTWRHTSDGAPQLRIARHHIMPSLSPDGRSFTAVGVVDRHSDTLTIRTP